MRKIFTQQFRAIQAFYPVFVIYKRKSKLDQFIDLKANFRVQGSLLNKAAEFFIEHCLEKNQFYKDFNR